MVAIVCCMLMFACADEKKENKTTTKTETSAKDTTPAFGIDISAYQGKEIEVLNLKESNLQFIICKATQGEALKDPMFSQNWAAIKERGYIRGAYHFFISSDSPRAQAAFFLSAIKDLETTDIPPIVDIEQESVVSKESAEEVQESALLLLQIIEKESNRIPIIYTNTEFAVDYLNNPEFAKYPLWIADYLARETPIVPDVWKEKGYAFWQKSDTYMLGGYTDDADVFNGDMDRLKTFIKNSNR